jgi:hypothetical protein
MDGPGRPDTLDVSVFRPVRSGDPSFVFANLTGFVQNPNTETTAAAIS